ncbi:MAG TPA: hypothetical protein VLA71_02470 [Algoriphagus sp.]|nr:hypothetical protein [Algoriphagus sp.]
MISLLGLITFLLRLTLAIQGQFVEVLPADFSEERICLDFSAPDQNVHPILNPESGNENALVEAEKEEKNETEGESLADLLEALYEASINALGQTYYNPFFGNKALLGDQHLYDLFHSWKIHLS